VTKLLSQQIFVAANIILSRQKNCNKCFVATSLLLSRQKTSFVVTNTWFCHDKMFVAAKMILVAAPANASQVLVQGRRWGVGGWWNGVTIPHISKKHPMCFLPHPPKKHTYISRQVLIQKGGGEGGWHQQKQTCYKTLITCLEPRSREAVSLLESGE